MFHSVWHWKGHPRILGPVLYPLFRRYVRKLESSQQRAAEADRAVMAYLDKEDTKSDLIAAHNYLKNNCKDNGDKFSVVTNGKLQWKKEQANSSLGDSG